MRRRMMKSKIHRMTVTDANLNYVGSITLDPVLLGLADIREWEQVCVVDIDNGNRFETYAIPGEPGQGACCLNGAAARGLAAKVARGEGARDRRRSSLPSSRARCWRTLARRSTGTVARWLTGGTANQHPTVCLHSDFSSLGFSHSSNTMREIGSEVLTTS